MKKHKVDAFKAIADPRRRKIIQLLMVSSTLSLHAIVDSFDMSRQAISRHINTLEQSGILITKKQGREMMCHLDMTPLQEVIDVANYYRSFWDDKMNNLEKLIISKKS